MTRSGPGQVDEGASRLAAVPGPAVSALSSGTGAAAARPEEAFVQLGVAFAGRSHDVVGRVAGRIEQRRAAAAAAIDRRDPVAAAVSRHPSQAGAATGDAEGRGRDRSGVPDDPVHQRPDVLQRTELATEALARLIATGTGPNPQQLSLLAVAGQAALSRPAPPAELVAWHLCWRDVAGEVLCEVASRIGSDPDTLGHALHLIHTGADAALVAMIAQLDADGSQARARLQEENARLAEGLLHDPVTGAANRTLLLDRFGHALQGCVRRFSGVAVYYLDLDGFAAVNQEVGRDAGDQLLRLASARLAAAVRTSDTVARLGDDHFVVLCEDFRGGQPSATTVAGRLAAAMAEPFALGGRAVMVTASTGVTLGGPGDDPEELLAMSAAAKDLAKQRGGNRTELFHRAADHV